MSQDILKVAHIDPAMRTHPVKTHGVGGLAGGFARSRSFSGNVLRAPVPGQELVDALGRMIWQPGEHVGEPGLWVYIVELRGRDQRVDERRAPRTLRRAA